MNLLHHTQHRPWPLPPGPWIMKQTWNHLLFWHWPLPPEQLAGRLPQGLQLDCVEGKAWISISPFRLTGLQLLGLPALPFGSRFNELNVRTYVRVNDKPGVYFFSLDASSPIAVFNARAFYKLPYYSARMSFQKSGEAIRYTCKALHTQPGVFSATYQPIAAVFQAAPASLDHWLTERYCLYTVDHHQKLYRAEIHHLSWPLQPAEAHIECNTMLESHGLLSPKLAPRLTYTKQLDVLVWPLKRLS